MFHNKPQAKVIKHRRRRRSFPLLGENKSKSFIFYIFFPYQSSDLWTHFLGTTKTE